MTRGVVDQHRAWAAAMRAGNFARAWEMNDEHLRELKDEKHTGPRHQQVIWRGEQLAGRRVLVRCYHGLGDTIQFLRFMPALRRLASDVTLFCQTPLLPLAGRVAGVDRVLSLHDGSPEVDFDVDIEIMEVPHAIRAGSELIAMTKPYLAVPDSQACLPSRQLDKISVGLVWEVGSWDKRRSIPSSLLGKLVSDRVQLYSLQLDADREEREQIPAIDASTPDIELLAARLRALDLLVCVDTMVAHLAGALGCEAWVLLHTDCDWRWPTAGDRSIWYPRAKTFHQTSPGEWSAAIREVKNALEIRCRPES